MQKEEFLSQYNILDTDLEKAEIGIDELQLIMNEKGFISKEDVTNLAKKINKPISEIYGVLTFYSQFKMIPTVKYNIEICTGTACYILGAEKVIEAFKKELNVELFENTPDNMFRVSSVRCLGCCSLAPVVSINGKIYEKVKPEQVAEIIKKLRQGE